MNGRPASEILASDDRRAGMKASEPTYVAEIANADGRILVTIIPPSSMTTFSRSFHAICDAERWLLRLVRAGLSARDRARLLEQELVAFEIASIGPIRIVDNRRSKRCPLPGFFV